MCIKLLINYEDKGVFRITLLLTLINSLICGILFLNNKFNKNLIKRRYQMKKVLYLFLVLIVFSPPVISQITQGGIKTTTNEWRWVPNSIPTIDWANTKTFLVENEKYQVFSSNGTTIKNGGWFIQTDWYKNFPTYEVPDTLAIDVRIISKTSNIIEHRISIGIQGSNWYFSGYEKKVNLNSPEWQKIKIDMTKEKISYKDFFKLYITNLPISKDSCYISIDIAVDNLRGIYANGKEIVFDDFSGELTDVKNEVIPTKLVLEQNYPNPFNPTTSIKFSIPKQEFVNLKVYDILGKEITTLVNEVKSAGNYEVNFNASNLPSGTYFYRIQSGNYVETKKMILIK